MSLGNVLRTAAPIAAGYYTGGTGTSLFGLGATGSAIAAGALTGAGIAALSGGDILTSAAMGGLGGYGGGELGAAFNPAVEGLGKSGLTTAEFNAITQDPNVISGAIDSGVSGGVDISSAFPSTATPGSYNLAGTGSTALSGAGVQLNSAAMPTVGTEGISSNFYAGINPTESVSRYTNIAESAIPNPVDRSFSAGVERLGDGSMSKGAMKLGLTSLPLIAAAAYEEPLTYDQMKEAEAYDPDETLNLLDPELDSGIEDVINEDSGLRLYAKEGGMVPTYAEGGTIESRADQGMRDALARNQGTAYTQPTTTAPSNNIKIAGADNSTSNLTGGVGSLNVNSGTIGQSPNAIAEAARLKAIVDARPKYITPKSGVNVGGAGGPGSFSVPSEFVMGQGYMPTGAIMQGPAQNYYRDIAGNFILRAKGGPIPAAYAKGGMLEGPGDGMSDSLAAQIDGSQPAALSQGEFVVPADVVSHLGNGSSDAGSKRLYAMMDEVRKARTGTEKQGKEINPERYMPA